ncbi:glycoside hydrolase family 65 protein [Providencia rettgeri]|uniref:glycoside hydrolase family 65 protein n=1 Tax=Providencia rettgeri TaxID=587 RepID=UPI00141A5C07|nr:glycoside hydrolase family 65 protein [Providencia rettgeri]NIH07128.1 glycoside hydrolase family 65 protein [Providencia rettgeri]
MKYLLIIFSSAGVSIECEQKKYSYSFNVADSTYKDWLALMDKLKQDFQSINGGAIYSPSNEYRSNVIKTKDNKFIELATIFTESLNSPFIYSTSSSLDSYSELEKQLECRENELTWSIEYSGLPSGKDEYCQESLLTVGNGYIGLRGTLPEMTISNDYYPATYIAGLYNQAASQIEDHNVINEDFVNAPNGQYITLQIDGDEPIHPSNVKALSCQRHLNLKTGLMSADWTVETAKGKQIRIRSHKFTNMDSMSNYCIQYQFTPLNFSGEIKVITKLEGNTYNSGVERYRSLNPHHYHVLVCEASEQRAHILAKTNQSQIGVGVASIISGDFFSPQDIVCDLTESVAEQSVVFMAKQDEVYTFEKCVAITTSTAYPDNWQDVINWQHSSLQTQLSQSQQAWNTLWDSADIVVKGDLMTQKLLRLHTYHLLSSASPYSNEKNHLDVSVTARGLHGEAYRGHIFWDEIFIFPFYIMHFPKTARQLLCYRYLRLDAARAAAKAEGRKGAMFPWQSGHDGSEQTQVLHLNPLSGQWDPDHSCRQRHVSLAIAYNVWLYWRNTHDHVFMEDYGLELLKEIAEFWVSMCQWDKKAQRFHISGVMGPDEFHEKYPDAEEGGLKDNAYTNLMVAWLFNEIIDFYHNNHFTERLEKLGFHQSELEKIQQIKTHLAITLDNNEIIEQFSGYFELEDLDWDSYRQKYGNIYRMDRILRKENKSADDFKVAKQADTLMLFNNLDEYAVKSLIESLGYPLSDTFAQKNLHYYLERTSHGSTLSRIVHAYLAEQINLHDLSWQLYKDALYSDYNDIQGGTTAEGIHTGVMAATLNTTIMAYAGIDIRHYTLKVNPSLPKQWDRLNFKLTHQNIVYHFDITHEKVSVMSGKPCDICIKNNSYSLNANAIFSLNYNKGK